MKIIIVEDEIPAYKRILKLILEIDSSIEIVGHADSISSAISLFGKHPQVDLALMDIELADGQSFEIFKHVDVLCPIIFTTAYDEFALKAFKLNSIDYLLKPIDPKELKAALHKFTNTQSKSISFDLNQLLSTFKPVVSQNYKERFLVKLGSKLISIPVAEIAYFQASDKLVYLIGADQKKYIIDHSIEELAGMLNPKNFFHLNRQFLSSLQAIESVSTYFNGKLKIHLRPPVTEEVIVSREKSTEFKQWLNT